MGRGTGGGDHDGLKRDEERLARVFILDSFENVSAGPV
jgi:hypothetical protein